MRRLVLVPLLALIVGCGELSTEPEGFQPLLAVAGSGMIPFKGVLTQESQGADAPGPSFDLLCANAVAGGAPGEVWIPQRTIFGKMMSTHLGASTIAQNGCVEISPLFGAPGVIEANGEATITTASGDEVFYRYSGFVDPVTFIADVAVMVIGGSGRFVGATGGFSATSEGNSLAFPVVFPFSGAISSVGSVKGVKP